MIKSFETLSKLWGHNTHFPWFIIKKSASCFIISNKRVWIYLEIQQNHITLRKILKYTLNGSKIGGEISNTIIRNTINLSLNEGFKCDLIIHEWLFSCSWYQNVGLSIRSIEFTYTILPLVIKAPEYNMNLFRMLFCLGLSYSCKTCLCISGLEGEYEYNIAG